MLRSRFLSPFFKKKSVICLLQQRHISELKRFYKAAMVTEAAGGGYEIALDRKKLKTPMGKLFIVPNEAMAIGVATEWNGQKEFIKRHGMHLTSLCNTAIDNPTHRDRQTVINGVLDFIDTDTVLYQLDEPEELYQLQQNKWGPLINYVNNRYNTTIAPTTGIGVPDLPKQATEEFKKHLKSQSKWALVGYTHCVENLKSLIIAICLLDRQITVEDAVYLSRLELEYQIGKWGNVEWHHDLELHDLRARVAAATLLVHFSDEDDRTFKFRQGFGTPV